MRARPSTWRDGALKIIVIDRHGILAFAQLRAIAWEN
jgi:hypothetical protein